MPISITQQVGECRGRGSQIPLEEGGISSPDTPNVNSRHRYLAVLPVSSLAPRFTTLRMTGPGLVSLWIVPSVFQSGHVVRHQLVLFQPLDQVAFTRNIIG